jgi:hypothetical protein
MNKKQLLKKYDVILELYYGLEIKSGWLHIIENMLEQIYLTTKDLKITRIDEKYGRLRVLYDSTMDWLPRSVESDIEAIINAAVTQSVGTCVTCGKQASITRDTGSPVCVRCRK